MNSLIARWCFAVAVVVASVLVVSPQGDAKPGGGQSVYAATGPAHTSLTEGLMPLSFDFTVSSDLETTGDVHQDAACDESACQRSCSAAGWCEGQCLSNRCRCVFRPGPLGCP